MTLTVEMLNHPSTNPNRPRRAYFPHLRMEFTLDRNPVMPSTLDTERFVSIVVEHPTDPAQVMYIDMPRDAQVVWADETPNDTP